MAIPDPDVNSKRVSAILDAIVYDAVANFTRCGGTSNIFYYGYDTTRKACSDRLNVIIFRPIYFAVWKALLLFGSERGVLKKRVPVTEESTFINVSLYTMEPMNPEGTELIVVKIEEPKED